MTEPPRSRLPWVYVVRIKDGIPHITKYRYRAKAKNGVTVGMANVPATFPVMKVNGYMISGMMTRGKGCEDGVLCAPKVSGTATSVEIVLKNMGPTDLGYLTSCGLPWNIETPDVPGEFAKLKAAGAIVVREPYEFEGAPGSWITTLADPDDNYFQLATPMGPAE